MASLKISRIAPAWRPTVQVTTAWVLIRFARVVNVRRSMQLCSALGIDPIWPERRDVRFWHKADIARLSSNVRFWGQRGHYANLRECPLMTKADISDRCPCDARQVATCYKSAHLT